MECGHVEEGVQAKRPRECPECGAPTTAFEFFAYDDTEEEWDSDDEGSEYEDDRAVGDDEYEDDEDLDEEDEDY
jgi:hypothetical protein